MHGGGAEHVLCVRKSATPALTSADPQPGAKLKVYDCHSAPWQVFYFHRGMLELVDWSELDGKRGEGGRRCRKGRTEAAQAKRPLTSRPVRCCTIVGGYLLRLQECHTGAEQRFVSAPYMA